jgi:hypothetical protein
MIDGGSSSSSFQGKALYTMGVARRLSGDIRGALRLQRQALGALARGRSSPLTRMKALTEIGLGLVDVGRPREALKTLGQALAVSRQVQTHAAPDRADILVGLGRANLAIDRRAEACRALRAANAFWRGFDSRTREAREAARWRSRCS